ncbi:MAG: JAB domain-containing protein [Bacteroidales bacterium]|nr:JAB domain-containing protein [Bacteroidales bacterium]
MVLCLNRANKVLGWAKIGQGGISGTVTDPKVIFQIALKANASSIILAHNHPSGNKYHSEADNKLTRKIKNAGEFMDLQILDHIILIADGYYSFADEGSI